MSPRHEFFYQALPMRVAFGVGSRHLLTDEVEFLGLKRVLILTTGSHRHWADEFSAALGTRAVGIFAGARIHVPVSTAEEARATASSLSADGVVALGGGSSIGLGKAVALTTGLPLIAVPTTYAGSEMTSIWGLTENGEKVTGRDPSVLPRSVIYDPELTTSLPIATSVTSGINAIAHAVEGMYAPDSSPVVSLMAREGVASMLRALPSLHRDPEDLAARSEALIGAWLCGATLGATTMGLHHKICHVLGGSFDLPHAETHTVVLPHVIAFNSSSVPEVVGELREMTGGADPALFIRDLAASLGAPQSLAALGFGVDDIERAVDLVMSAPYTNPRAVDADAVRSIISNAQHGREPGS